MTTDQQPTIDAAGVEGIVAEIWESMLGLPIGPAELPDEPGRELRAAVQITGGWEGAFIIECPESSARAFTAAMLGEDDPGAIDAAEVLDVVGELANMAGGNLKAVVAAESRLSLPTVTAGRDLDLSVLGASEVVRSRFVAGGSTFTVVVVARSV
jgi:chemotaxis protein CheX